MLRWPPASRATTVTSPWLYATRSSRRSQANAVHDDIISVSTTRRCGAAGTGGPTPEVGNGRHRPARRLPVASVDQRPCRGDRSHVVRILCGVTLRMSRALFPVVEERRPMTVPHRGQALRDHHSGRRRPVRGVRGDWRPALGEPSDAGGRRALATTGSNMGAWRSDRSTTWLDLTATLRSRGRPAAGEPICARPTSACVRPPHERPTA